MTTRAIGRSRPLGSERALHDLGVSPVRERFEGLLRRQPANRIDLVPSCRLGAFPRRHCEVPHPLRASSCVLVLGHGDLVSELTGEAGLLLDFPLGSVQSSYRGRWTTRISARRLRPGPTITPPAARTSSRGLTPSPACIYLTSYVNSR